jgi:hypothetical protein
MVREGIRWVVIALTAGFCLAAATDIYFQLRRWRSISTRLQGWARRYPLYSGVLILIFGALLAHFFLTANPQ